VGDCLHNNYWGVFTMTAIHLSALVSILIFLPIEVVRRKYDNIPTYVITATFLGIALCFDAYSHLGTPYVQWLILSGE